MARPRVAAGALFFDEEGRVLLVHPTYKDTWDIPGGYVEPGESPQQACEREVREELAIGSSVGRLLVVDWAPDDQGDKLLFVYDAGELTRDALARVRLQEDELDAIEFCSTQRLPERLNDRLVRRLSAAIRAKATGTTLSLVHGS